MKKLYKIQRTDIDNLSVSYDQYRSFIVCALSKDDVYQLTLEKGSITDWVKREYTTVIELGIANDNIQIGIIDYNYTAG